MSEFKDHFSSQSTGYGRFRPGYPEELFAELASFCSARERAWDCGCGTGQAAQMLARHFSEVVATDASAAQIEKAVPFERISYRVATAEESGLGNQSVDLVVVAQALHWFDFGRFYGEVQRVVRPGGVLAAIAYGLLRIDAEIDRLIDRLYVDLLGAYWPAERRHIDEAYRSIPFPFEPLQLGDWTLRAEWSFDHLLGYLETWSAVQRYREEKGACPVAGMREDFRSAWSPRTETKQVAWPMYFLVGRIE